jgi:hypothetical protein
MFEDSFDATVKRDRASFAQAKTGDLRIANRDLDTGRSVSPGEYGLTDRTYDRLLIKLAEKKFDGVTPELRANILSFYAHMKTPDPHGIGAQLEALKAIGPSVDPIGRPNDSIPPSGGPDEGLGLSLCCRQHSDFQSLQFERRLPFDEFDLAARCGLIL